MRYLLRKIIEICISRKLNEHCVSIPDKATAERYMPKYIIGGWINAFG